MNYVVDVALEKKPAAASAVQGKGKELPPKLTFHYGESFPTPFLAVLCPLTFIFYGGVCWFYFGGAEEGESLPKRGLPVLFLRSSFASYSVGLLSEAR